ncbi:ABC-three component system protein [Selenomonas bovis]|uniref:ABC-three component system protein n=1 Tax=Selenomonas bovis TaxID=416586 RepID=UPI00039E9A32|nr:ABC-three component system protein [Selenomonas bovis]
MINELNMSSYIDIMRKGLVEHDKQESAGRFLLNAINDQGYVIENGFSTSNLSPKKISRIVSRDDNVPDGIKQASTKQNVIDDTIKYFRNEVAKDLNPHTLDDTTDMLVKVIEADDSISESKKKKLIAFHEKGDEPKFLGEVFLYAVNKSNKKVGAEVKYADAPLLAEANYECPLCHKKLVDTIKGKAIKRYAITQIFPDDLDEDTAAAFKVVHPAPAHLNKLENLIALDVGCAEKYSIDPTVEEYSQLYEIKKELTQNYKAKMEVNGVQLEEDIRTVLDALSQIKDASELVELEYNALRVDEKFKPENFILKNETKVQVVTYYRYIEKVFSNSTSDFDTIAAEVKISSSKLEKAGLLQADIITNLSEWIRNKAGLGTESRLACNIVVAFFVQNCEVFHNEAS